MLRTGLCCRSGLGLHLAGYSRSNMRYSQKLPGCLYSMTAVMSVSIAAQLHGS